MSEKKKNIALRISTVLAGILLALLVLCIVALLAADIVLSTGLPSRIVDKYLPEYVDADVSYSKLTASVKRSGEASLNIDSLYVINPQVSLSHGDTVLYATSLSAGIQLFSLLNDKIEITHVKADELRLFAGIDKEGKANWDILTLPPVDTITPKDSIIWDYQLKDINMGPGSLAVFEDMTTETFLALNIEDLKFEGDQRGFDFNLNSDLDFRIDEIGINDEIPLELEGNIKTIKDSSDVNIKLSVKDYSLRTSKALGRAVILTNLDLLAQMSSEGVVDLTAENLALSTDGLKLKSFAKVNDLLGDDPSFVLDLEGEAELSKLKKFLPDSLSDINAEGSLDFSASANARFSQMNMYMFNEADVQASIKADSLILEDDKSGVLAYVRNPNFALIPGELALAVDSVNLAIGKDIYMRGKGMQVVARNSQQLMVSQENVLPFIGMLKADAFTMRSSDSTIVGTRISENYFTIEQLQNENSKSTRINLESANGNLFLHNSLSRVVLSNVGIIAQARKVERDSLAMVSRDSLRRGRRSGAIERQDNEFRRADLNIFLDESFTSLFRTWSPSGRLHFSEGTLTTPIFPLENRIDNLDAFFTVDGLGIENARITSGSSDLSVNGRLDGLRSTLTGSRRPGIIRLSMNAESDRINVNELYAAYSLGKEFIPDEKIAQLEDEEFEELVIVDTLENSTIDSLNYSMIIMPGNLMAEVTMSVANLDYDTLEFRNLNTDIALRQRCLQLTNTKAETDFGRLNLDGFYSSANKNDVSAGFSLLLNDITADKLISLIPAVDKAAPMIKSFKGNLDCEFAATAQLDTNMIIQVPSLNGVFKLSGSELLIQDLGGLKRITKLLKFKDTSEGQIDDMYTYGIISDNTLEVFPFILGVDRYVMALKGYHKFESDFDYHISLIESPMPFRIGIDIYGKSFSDWKFKLVAPQYKSKKIPLFTEQVDEMQLNLLTSIKEIFSRGSERALSESRRMQRVLEVRTREEGLYEGSSILSLEEQNIMDDYMLEIEIEEESENINAEIEKLIEELL